MGAIQNLEKGQLGAALNDIVSWVEGGVAALESQFPIIGQFLTQFTSDLGQKVLSDAEALAPSVIAGTTSFTAAAATLANQAVMAGLATAESDAAAVAMNALRLYVSAPVPAAPPAA